MAFGKSLEKKEPHMVKLIYSKDGTPLRRATPKEHMSKKERRRRRKAFNKVVIGGKT